jgi:hypothetical protein
MSSAIEAGNILLELVQAMHERRMQTTTPSINHCERSDIGVLIETLGYGFLMETLELEQSIFVAEYPDMASFSRETRQNMKEAVLEHFQRCDRCQLEAAAEEEWNDSFSSFLNSQSHSVRAVLKNKRHTTRDKARALTAGSGNSFS